MGRNAVETVMGAVVLLIAGIFLALAYKYAEIRMVEGYVITAKFNRVDGLQRGSDVRIGGVKVGSVVDQFIDPQDYRAVVTVSIRSDLKLPLDSSASIASDGLLGGKYVKLEPGFETAMIEPGGEITNTKDVVVIEDLLGRLIFLAAESGGLGGGLDQ